MNFKRIVLHSSLSALVITLILATQTSPIFASVLSLSPATITTPVGSTFSTQLQLDTQNSQVDAVQITITYPQDLVSVSSITPGDNFKTTVEQTTDNGTI